MSPFRMLGMKSLLDRVWTSLNLISSIPFFFMYDEWKNMMRNTLRSYTCMT
jgi:hypothetical protein